RAGSVGGLRDRLVGWRLHDEPAARRRPQRTGVRRVRIRRGAARAGAWRPCAAGRARPLLLEERQVDPRVAPPARGRARLLGVAGLPQPWRPVARVALQRRLTFAATSWTAAAPGH